MKLVPETQRELFEVEMTHKIQSLLNTQREEIVKFINKIEVQGIILFSKEESDKKIINFVKEVIQQNNELIINKIKEM